MIGQAEHLLVISDVICIFCMFFRQLYCVLFRIPNTLERSGKKIRIFKWKKKGYFTCSAQTMLPVSASITRDCMLTPSDKHLTHNTQSRHGSYKMQVTMTIPNWDPILNPFTRAFYTDYVGELTKDCFCALLI